MAIGYFSYSIECHARMYILFAMRDVLQTNENRV